jgi:hypothetical protein
MDTFDTTKLVVSNKNVSSCHQHHKQILNEPKFQNVLNAFNCWKSLKNFAYIAPLESATVVGKPVRDCTLILAGITHIVINLEQTRATRSHFLYWFCTLAMAGPQLINSLRREIKEQQNRSKI